MKKSNPQSAFPVLFVAALIMAFGGGQLAADQGYISCDWRRGEAHKMHWPQLPDLGYTGMDVEMSLVSLADDFVCTATGHIKDIHIWGSFVDDVLPQRGPDSLTFELSIYSDIPAEADSWSMPGDLLWSRMFRPGEYSVRMVHDGPEDWYDPVTGRYLPDNHRRAYQYNFCIEDDPFLQEEGKIYWLAVKDVGPRPVFTFTSATEDVHSPGDSCGTLNVVGDLTLNSFSVYVWELEAGCSDLINVGGNLTLETGWGLKIETSQPPTVGDYVLFTYGGSLNDGSPVFDVTGAPGWDASNLSVVDDPVEKKVYLRVGAELPTVAYSFGWKTTTAERHWNDDAVYLLAGAAGVPSWLPMTYPDGHEYAAKTVDLAFVITGGDETQSEHDLGDAPDSSNSFPGTPMLAYPATGVVADYPTVYEAGSPPYGPIHWEPEAFVYLGRRVSVENEADIGFDEDSCNNIDPPGDLSDLDDGDDGVKLPLVLPHCQEATFDYVVTVATSVGNLVYVNAWCDWNRDGDWDDVPECPTGDQAPEWAVQNQQLLLPGPGTFSFTTPRFMCWHPPGVAQPPPMWMRITVAERPWGAVASSAMHSGGSGPVDGHQYGETEDYYVYASEEPGPSRYDWGDAPDPTYPTLALNNGANHLIAGPWLGDETDAPDPEPDGQPNLDALGDDGDGNDDEDGVSIPPLFPGQPGDITIEVRGGGGIVQAWIDFDGDGTWQASEHIHNGFLPVGTHIISFSVPDSAVVGETIARFRISRQGGLGPQGPARDGEVEDHRVSIGYGCQPLSGPMPTGQQFIRGDANQDYQVDMADAMFIMSYLSGGGPSPECMDAADADDNGTVDTSDVTSILNYTLGVAPPPPPPFPDCGPDPTDDSLTCDKYDLCPGDSIPVALQDTKWIQLPDVTNHGIDIRVDSSDGSIRTLADDFECRSRSLITDVHLWGSWKDDVKGDIKRIHLSIHPDDPAGPAGPDPDNRFSKPAQQVLWAKDFFTGQFQEGLYHKVRDPGEWWWDPLTGQYGPGGDTEIWQIDIDIAPADAFLQAGSQDNPVIYWLDVQVDTEGGEFGWKTRRWPDHYMDDAVWEVFFGLLPHVWRELYYPKTHPYYSREGNSIDMAFCLTYSPETPPQPTTRPVSPTRCPVVQTQCPAVQTQCPPVVSQCPPVVSTCAAIRTMCQVAETQCPVLETLCPAMETECGPMITECPPTDTTCPALLTQCPVYETRCPTEPTKCPTYQTRCPAVLTECPPMETECSATRITECPPTDTTCPALLTQCPVYETRCPADPTRCPPDETRCPVTLTECRSIETLCPLTLTRCLRIETRCPATETECQPVDTECPRELTTCPAIPTTCEIIRTQCPIETVCPPTETECRPVDTQCPPLETECPVSFTRCPNTRTICSSCFETVFPNCPLPITVFPCGPLMEGTKNSPVMAQCPTIEVQCPTVVPKHLLAKAR